MQHFSEPLVSPQPDPARDSREQSFLEKSGALALCSSSRVSSRILGNQTGEKEKQKPLHPLVKEALGKWEPLCPHSGWAAAETTCSTAGPEGPFQPHTLHRVPLALCFGFLSHCSLPRNLITQLKGQPHPNTSQGHFLLGKETH